MKNLDRTAARLALAALSMAACPFGSVHSQDEPIDAGSHPQAHHHYRLIDVGTFGGPNGQFSTPSGHVLNEQGVAVGIADTKIADPTCYFDCLIDRAFERKDGVTIDLGALPGGQSSFAYVLNNHGLIAGSSQIGTIDPLTGLRELRGAMWEGGKVFEVQTLV